MKHKGILIFPIALVFFETVTYLANDMYLPSLPSLIKDLGIDHERAKLTLLYWFLGAASMQLFMGPLSDRYGRKVVIVVSAFLYVLSSLFCAMTDNITLMLIARFIQGTAVCSVVVAGYAAIHELYDTTTAIKIISIMFSITILAPALGPLFGALIIQVASWRAIFYLLAFLGLINLFSLMIVMPETVKVATPIHFRSIFKDYFQISTRIAFLGFALPECLLMMAFICWIIESPFIIIEKYQQSTLVYGLIQLYIFVSFFVGGLITKRLVNKIQTIKIVFLGLGAAFIAALGLVLTTLYFANHENLFLIVAFMMLLAIGSAMIFGPLNRLAIEACTEPMGRRMAIFSSLISFFCVFGTFLMTLFSDKTMNNLALVMTADTFLAFFLFFLFIKSKYYLPPSASPSLI